MYFSNDPWEGVIPVNNQWNSANTVQRYHWHPEPGGRDDPLTSGQLLSFVGATANYKQLDRQYVSPPLRGVQIISGFCTGFLQVQEFVTNDNVDRIVTHMRLVSNDGLTNRLQTGYFLTGRVGSKEFPTAMTNRCIVSGNTNTLLSNMTGQDGDRIVLEIGYSNTTAGTTPQARAVWGAGGYNVTGQCGYNTTGAGVSQESQTSTNCWPWFGFNNVVLDFYDEPTLVTCD
jgi:hypothetical protein